MMTTTMRRKNLSPLIYTARKGLRKFTFHDSDDESSIDEEQAEEQQQKLMMFS